MKKQTIGIIGLGLIGGSFALALKKKNPQLTIIGSDIKAEHEHIALQRGIADEIKKMDDLISHSDIIAVAIPADHAPNIIQEVLNKIVHQTVLDVGSVKLLLSSTIDNHAKRKLFVSTHPMWGTEFSGPQHATEDSFAGKKVVFCDTEKSDKERVELIKDLYASIGMEGVEMSSKEHDMHTAYVSHISHLVSFVLSLAVLEKEKEEDKILMLASAGFESTVRLAKSSAAMWSPIFVENQKNILQVLDEVIYFMNAFKDAMIKKDEQAVTTLIKKANAIRKILGK